MKQKDKLKIGLISYRSNPFSGGQGIYIRHLSNALYELGHEVEVISGPPYPEIRKEISLVKIPSLDLFASQNRLKEFKLNFLTSYIDLVEWLSVMTGGFPEPYTFGRRLKNFLKNKKGEYDILHDNQSLASSLLTIQLEFPLLSTIHHPISRDYKLELDNAKFYKQKLLIKRWHSFLGMQMRVAKRLDNILCVSKQSSLDVAEDFGVSPSNISVVLNGVDMNVFKPNNLVQKVPNRLVTAASADVPLKGLEFLIRSLPEIRSFAPEISLEVIGRAQEGGQVDNLIKELKLQKVVNFNHGLSEKEVANLYCSSEIAVIPSLYEGFGFGAAEAMACALPVISTTSGGLSEVVGDAAKIIPSGSSRKISEAVILLLKDESKKRSYAEKGLSRMKEDFSWINSAKLTVQAYQDTMNKFQNKVI
ncbi:MAG: glycosyltransferase family 4 protein [SAR86 cluster bacterium]|nr:glycosyltransferase family 4 protein [SAR86 cluster bacterium]